METQQILILIAIAFASGVGAGYTFPKSSKSTTEVTEKKIKPQQIVNQSRFDAAKEVAHLWGYVLTLADASRYSNYVRYNVYKDGVKIGWSNSTAETVQGLYYEIVDNCQRYFPSMEKKNNRLDKLVVDKKIEVLKESKKQL